MFGVELPLRLPWPIPASSPSPTCFCCCSETAPPRPSPGACGRPRFGRRNSRGSGYSVLAMDKLKSLIKLIRGHSTLVRLLPISCGGENAATTTSMASRPAVLAMWTTRRNVAAATVLLSCSFSCYRFAAVVASAPMKVGMVVKGQKWGCSYVLLWLMKWVRWLESHAAALCLQQQVCCSVLGGLPCFNLNRDV